MKKSDILEIAKPILFNTDMVFAIMMGWKTETRRLAKKVEPFNHTGMYFYAMVKGKAEGPMSRELIAKSKVAPYQVGDYLYVRETWCNVNKPEYEPDYYYFADSRIAEDYDSSEWTWKPSIHMPKKAARIFLKVTEVSLEKLQDITYEGAKAEGIRIRNVGLPSGKREMVEKFSELWDTTVSKKDKYLYDWKANPYVWVIKFERIECDDE